MKTDKELSLKKNLYRMLQGYKYTQLLYLAAKMGIADLLHDKPKNIQDLARLTKVNIHILNRILRAFISTGLIIKSEDSFFQTTPLGELIRKGNPHSLYEIALYTGEVLYPAWGGLLHTLQTGETSFNHVFGMGIFEYFNKNAQIQGNFNNYLAQISSQIAKLLINVYDFSSIKKVVDIGGGYGSLITTILKAHPRLTGVLFDMPSVIEEARRRIKSAGILNRCDFVAGNIFDSVPEDGDAYILKWILHDWSDDKCIHILNNCYSAARKDSILLIVEQIMPECIEGYTTVVELDIAMMVQSGGVERTQREYEKLLKLTGFQVIQVRCIDSETYLIEAKPI